VNFGGKRVLHFEVG